ncbi:MAG: hypothetical protein A2167_03550 [Planctomycetes bacterium RBG_13_46_10]|nr:MAG: hypothetical protein A2167_03550 [Planctomycetes bacterium RBG_13_46_10]
MRRDEDPRELQHILKYAILGYVSEDSFDGKRILDFGCGSGSSTAVIARMFPNTEIVGVDFNNDLLSIARLRAEHYGFNNVTFVLSPGVDNLPSELGSFDYVILSAVYEHLLPSERETLLPKLWLHLKPGGIMFINQTYYRYFPIESHTTRLPLINYLSDKVALRLVRMFSSSVGPDDTWETLLRKGIRGASVKEISSILNTTSQKPIFLEPERLGMRDRIDLWYQLSSNAGLMTLRKFFVCCLKILKKITGSTITPSLSLAIKKSPL